MLEAAQVDGDLLSSNYVGLLSCCFFLQYLRVIFFLKKKSSYFSNFRALA
jgi:hypothetical protein